MNGSTGSKSTASTCVTLRVSSSTCSLPGTPPPPPPPPPPPRLAGGVADAAATPEAATPGTAPGVRCPEELCRRAAIKSCTGPVVAPAVPWICPGVAPAVCDADEPRRNEGSMGGGGRTQNTEHREGKGRKEPGSQFAKATRLPFPLRFGQEDPRDPTQRPPGCLGSTGEGRGHTSPNPNPNPNPSQRRANGPSAPRRITGP